MSAALFGFLRRALEEAELVGVLAAVGGDAGSFQGAEDVVWSVGFGEVLAVLGFVVLCVGEVVLGRLEAGACVEDGFGLGTPGGVEGRVSEDAVGY